MAKLPFSTIYYPFKSLWTLTKFHCVTFQGMKGRAQMWTPYVMQQHLPPCVSHRLLWVISSGAMRLIPPQFSRHLLSHIVFFCDYSLWCLLSPAPCWWSFNHSLPLFRSWFPRRRWSPIMVSPTHLLQQEHPLWCCIRVNPSSSPRTDSSVCPSVDPFVLQHKRKCWVRYT